MGRAKPIPRMRVLVFAALCALAFNPGSAAADQFTLKDGRKITGTIVGYDQDMFRVQTDFGFVLIRKDMVVSIRVEAGPKKNSPAEVKPPTGNGADGGPAPETAERPRRTAPAPPPSARPAPPAPPVSHPLDQPLPAQLREHMEGNTYVSDTFQFAFYKPPEWKLFGELHREKGSAIVAMSSENDQTLFFVDRQAWSGAPNLNDDRVEANLRKSYQDYKKLSESSAEMDGHAAIRRTFTGAIDGVEWHGVSVRVERGNTVFGIIGLTSDETYLFQEAVIDKMIRSFHFLDAAANQAGPKTQAKN